jgi:hypothetical protein
MFASSGDSHLVKTLLEILNDPCDNVWVNLRDLGVINILGNSTLLSCN